MSIRIKQINKKFINYTALDNIELEVPTGKMVALLGPSGCGKTTLLRIIAGLETADSGEIFFDGKNVTNVHTRDRKVGFMFQNYALFKHMNVSENIAFGLKVLPAKQRPNKSEIQQKVDELLQLIKLERVAKYYPHQLSGGQRQRVALARAIAVSPNLLLLDEPFGALDTKVRKELRQWLKDIHKKLNITSILVTHDQEEALELADIVVVMNQGKIEQIDAAMNLYNNPSSYFVASFLGDINEFSSAKISNNQLIVGDFSQTAPVQYHATEREIIAYARPHELQLSHNPSNAIAEAQIVAIEHAGVYTKIFVTVAADISLQKLEIHVSKQNHAQQGYEIGEKHYLTPDNMLLFESKNTSISH